MKKARGILLLGLSLALSVAVFAACDSDEEDSGHQHEYDGGCDAICNVCGEERETTADHDYSALSKDGNYHFTVCSVCGAEKPDSRENHAYGLKKGNGQHWEACDCGAEKTGSRANHDYKWKKEGGQHWKECECGEADPATPKAAHKYEWKSADGQHWKECACGEVDSSVTKAAHSYVPKTDGSQHWEECSVCGAIDPAHPKTDHDYEWKSKDGKHWMECSECEEIDPAHPEADHDYEWKSEDGEHWKECECGEEDPETDKEGHKYEWKSADGKHWKECECEEIDPEHPKADHDYEWKSSGKDGQHWMECTECEEVDPAHPEDDHSFNTPKHDHEYHWNECVCGEKKDVLEHTSGWEIQGDQHWRECGTCGFGRDESEGTHVYDRWDIQEGTHQAKCECGALTGTAEAHKYDQWKIEATTHQAMCECGATQGEAIPHNHQWKIETDGHSYVCECGDEEVAKTAHNYEWQTAGNTHKKVCECSDVEVAEAAHTYELKGGELSCSVCPKECTVNDLTTEDGYSKGYVYAEYADTLSFAFSYDLTKYAGYTVVDANGNPITTDTVGEHVYYIFKSDSDVACKVNAYVATQIIDTVEKMNSLQYNAGAASITGYYILAEAGLNYSGQTIKDSGNPGASDGFAGIFNGLGNTISNYTQPNEWKFHSLFGTLRGATIKNVNFENVVVNGYNNSGLFAINIVSSTLENITITNFKFAYTATSQPVHWSSGIFSGSYVLSAVFKNITVDMNGNRLNALIGNNSTNHVNAASFENVDIYNTTEVISIFREVFWGDNDEGHGVNEIKMIVDDKSHAEVYRDKVGLTIYTDEGNTQYTFVIPVETIADAFVTEGNNDVVLKSDKFVVGTAYIVSGKEYAATKDGELSLPASILTVGENTVDVAFKTEGSRVYDGITFTYVIRATKIIMDVDDMDAVFFAGGTTFIEGYYVLGDDIDYENDTDKVKEVSGDHDGGFAGTFNGLGHTIKNYAQQQVNNGNKSLFGIVRNATIKNVNFVGVTISSQRGSVFGRNIYSSTIENITMTGVKFTSEMASGSSGLFGAWVVQGTYFRNIEITLDETEGYLHNLFCAGSYFTNYANYIQNVNVYNAKKVQSILNTGAATKAQYDGIPGLKIYTGADSSSPEYF